MATTEEPVARRTTALDKDALKRKYAQNGHQPTLEEVFMAATGTSLDEADSKEDNE